MKKSARSKSRSLGRATWEGDTAAATLIIGQNKGRQAANRTGFCALRPAKFSEAEVEKTVRRLRELQLQDADPTATRAAIAKRYSASAVAQKGWYKGDAERSIAITFHDESGDVERFRASMRHLADRASAVLCQDSVLLSFDTPGRRGAEGRSTSEEPTAEDRETRARAQELFSRRGRR